MIASFPSGRGRRGATPSVALALALLFAAPTIAPRAMAGDGCSTLLVSVFDDFNANGFQDFGEPGLSGWRIHLTGPSTRTDTTDAGGQILFSGVVPGSYQVREVTRPGWILTGPMGGTAGLNLTCDTESATSFGNRLCGLGACTPPPTCLRARFPFDECSGTIANEVMGNRDGTITGGGSSPSWGGASPVSACSMQFPGSPGTSQVNVADCPEHNFGTGGFTITAWFRKASADNDIHTLVDKRSAPFSTPTGYVFFEKYGRLGFQMGDGSGLPATYFMSSGPLVDDGAWHFAAVTVCRDPMNPSSNAVTIHMDGFSDTFTVGIPTGSVTSTQGIVIGQQCPGFDTTWPFKGSLDEIQLYRCCLGTSQLADLRSAAGYCQESAYVPSAVISYQPQVPAILTVCNYSLTPQTYHWTLAGLAAGGNCSIAGPTVFAPFSGTVTVPAASNGPACVNVPFTVFFPAGMSYPQAACYQATVQNAATGGCMSRTGRILKSGSTGGAWDHTEIALPAGAEVSVPFVLRNDGDVPVAILSSVFEETGDDPGGAYVRLNGLPPGTPVKGTLSIIAPHDSTRIPVTITMTEFAPLATHDIVLEADLDGDGTLERMSSMAVLSTTAEVVSGVAGPGPAGWSPGDAPARGTILLAASPNPFREGMDIELTLAGPESAVLVQLFDVTGRLVRTLRAGPLEAGRHRMSWDGRDDRGATPAAGVYFVRAIAGDGSVMARVVRVR